MSPWRSFQSIQVPANTVATVRPRYSLTSDIIGYRRCSRQYGYFGNDGFVPAQTVQIFYGTIIHQVLDRCHRHHSGLLGDTPGAMPTDQDVEEHFIEVESALRAHGVRAINSVMRDKALAVIQAFNRVEGPTLYPRVVDTEYRLESDRQQYVMRGVVDVLADAENSDPGEREIWDYKGTNRPENSDLSLKDYVWQMCVYAELYRTKTGTYPAKAVLYFVNELYTDPDDPPLTSRPARAAYEVHFTPELIQEALQEFDITTQEITQCKANQQWPAPGTPPDEGTCDVCDIRWNCLTNSGKYSLRFPV